MTVSQTGMDRFPKLSDMKPIVVPVTFVLAWVLVLFLLLGCQPGTKPTPSVFDALTTAESTITAGANTLKRAVELGTITTDDSDYHKAYTALHQAGEAMDVAWEAYRAGQLADADASKRLAMESYMLVRPILVRLSEDQ